MRLFEISDENIQMVQGILPEVYKNCTEFLNASLPTRRYLWRSTSRHGGPFFVGASRAGDRQPTDMNEEIQYRVDKFLIKKGFGALRSNSTFTWAGGIHAKPFMLKSNSFMIFPKNGFAFAWSDKFTDLFEYISDLLYQVKVNPDKERSEVIKEILQGQDSPSHWMKAFDDLFSYHNTGLDEALNNASEIMISGEYYAIHSTFVNEVTSYFFKG